MKKIYWLRRLLLLITMFGVGAAATGVTPTWIKFILIAGGGGDLTDNGISQTVTVKEGAATLMQAEVPSPAELRPYRTFLEVEQPSSPFVFRINRLGECALFEADGGIWKHEAMENVSQYLVNELKELIDSGSLTIIA